MKLICTAQNKISRIKITLLFILGSILIPAIPFYISYRFKMNELSVIVIFIEAIMIFSLVINKVMRYKLK